MSRHQPDLDTPKVLLLPSYIPWGHDQDALGRLQVVAAGWSFRLQVPKVLQYLLERLSRPHIIIVPWLSDPGVGVPQLPDKREDSYAIRNHGEGVPLSHTLLAIQEVY